MLRLAAAGKFQSVQLTAKSNRYKNAWKGNFQSRLQLKNGWGVVQLVGHLTVNEDGVGSSPTAPAIELSESYHELGR